MDRFLFVFFLILTIMVMISQTIHTYYVFHSFSKIKKKGLKEFQAAVFCSIFSFGVIGFVLKGNTKMAIGLAVIESVINMYYYAIDFWENGYKQFSGDGAEIKRKRRRSRLSFWRKNWIAIFMGLIIPAFIYFFAEEL